MTGRETPFVFDCRGESLLGILHEAAGTSRRAVLIVVGGPQYRVGSHRQFVLLARAFAAAGMPAMRFDYRGMGDSTGPYLGFEHIGEDIAAAIDALTARAPHVEEIVIWALCDAASAALFYAHSDPRVRGLVLLNPWTRTVASEAKTYLKHYYAARLFDPELWRKLASGRFDVRASLRSLGDMLRRAVRPQAASNACRGDGAAADSGRPLPDRMADAMRRFSGPVLLIMSGNDFTAREFDDAVAASATWRELLASPRITRRDLKDANHTFSRRAWRDQVAAWTLEWVGKAGPGRVTSAN
jgi:exosortase A-associated hydrolase 1